MLEQKDFVGNPYPIKACAVVFQNLMMNMPNSNVVKAALEQMEFIFVVDTHMSETALMADIVFPGAQYLERNDVNANWGTFRSIGYRQQVVPSWFGGMTEWQLFLELGAAMGFNGFKTSPENASDEAMQADEWAKFLQFGTGTPSAPSPWNNQMTFAQLKTSGVWVETSSNPTDPTSQAAVVPLIPASTDGATSTPKGGTHYRKYKRTSSGANNVETLTLGSQTVYIVRNASNARIGITTSATVPTSFEVGFGTDSRFAQFWDPRFYDYWRGATLRGDMGGNVSVAGDVRFHPLPWFTMPEQAPTWLQTGGTPLSGTFPLFFLSWKEVEHTHTRTFNNAWLMEMKGENRLLIHPNVAGTSIKEGDWVWVQTPYGLAKARAHITHGIQPECVGWVRGFGHWAMGDVAKGKGTHDNALLPPRAELHSGQAVNKEVACRIYREV
jgi:anaerobic selenocysteine-containing dehydrogenase